MPLKFSKLLLFVESYTISLSLKASFDPCPLSSLRRKRGERALGSKRVGEEEEGGRGKPPLLRPYAFLVSMSHGGQGRNDGQTPPAKVGEDLGSDTAVVDQRRPLLLF